MEHRTRRTSLLIGAALAVTAVAAVASSSVAPSAVEAAGAPYRVAVPNGSFEQQAVPAGSSVQRPTSSSWTFGETSGITRSASAWTNGLPAFPDGLNVAYVQNIGKFSVRAWVGPGDNLVFRSVQRANCCGVDHTIDVRVDGVVVGSVTPARNTWTTYTVPLGSTTHQVVTLEFMGRRLSGDRTVFIDDVFLERPAVDIPDEGLPKVEQEGILSTRTDVLGAGVLGVLKVGDSEPGVDTPVQAFTEWTNPVTGQRIIFVGGKFAQVQVASTRAITNQSYLAAFDADTGNWIPTFRPVLDGTVWDLGVTSDGKLIVGGQFTRVNNQPYTAGVAALDPATGDVITSWRASLVLTGSTTRPFARAVKVVGDSVYIGGLFSRVVRGPATADVWNSANVDKLSAVDGRPDSRWSGSVGGQVYDIDAANGRVYAVGYFTRVNGAARTSQAILDWTTGASIPGMLPMTFSSASRPYQQAVAIAGNEVWVGGSEHSSQAFTWSDNTRLRSIITDPFGDTQTMTVNNGFLYYGNHANPNTFAYTDATVWPGVNGWTTRDPAKWIVAVDLSSRTVVPMWTPRIGVASGEGGWELFTDSKNCMWAGGDFDRGSSNATGFIYVQGFARFCPVDTVAPTQPLGVAVTTAPTGVTIQWLASTDDRVGRVRYEIFKNDRPVATGLTALTFTDPAGTATDRYFVRALDVAGNASATTRVGIVGVDGLPPTTPANLAGTSAGDGALQFTWTASTDNIGVTGYRIYRNGVLVGEPTASPATITGLPVGAGRFQISAMDASGNESRRTASVDVTVTGTDVTPPSIPAGLMVTPGGDGVAALAWNASTDNVGVTGYEVYLDGSLLTTTSSTTLTWPGLPVGSASFQVAALDAAGNRSSRSPSVSVMISGLDTIAPSVPQNLTATSPADGQVQLSWTASTDNVGVTGYRVFRDGVFLSTVTGTSTLLTGQPTGTSLYQVSAVDAATNQSIRTAAVSVFVGGVDTTRPSVPGNFTAVPGADNEAVLSWTASSDKVGVTGYRIYRAGVLVTTVTETSVTLTGETTGSNSYQVSAIDAAGNESLRTASVTVMVTGVDVTRPSAPTNLTVVPGADNEAVLSWTASRDNVAVTGYRVYRSNVLVATVTDTTVTLTGQQTGTNSYQVSAIDAAANESSRTASVSVMVTGIDSTTPSVPRDLAGTSPSAGTVVLTWSASNDNVAVASYEVFRGGVTGAIQTVTTTTATITGLAPGSYTFQVRSVDTSGNRSARTASITVVVA